uniref:uncharacterized protein LOC122598414 isoform X2 n=1 Tax=Erigeron canadensis TaxID=72917 RepID=UPI001CB922E9|nr:uncharacterized protein LOC122598414 isoform X2 [Erigeron canadensis]
MATEVDDEYVEEEDEYGYLSDNYSTDDEDDDMESLIHFDLLKVPFEGYKDLSPEERVRWMTIHFIIQKNDFLFKPRRGQKSKVAEQVSKVAEESKVAEQVSKVVEEGSKVEEESKVTEDGDVEEESKVPKMNE